MLIETSLDSLELSPRLEGDTSNSLSDLVTIGTEDFAEWWLYLGCGD